MTSADENDAMTQQRLSQDLDEIVGIVAALLPIIASALAARRFGWRNVIAASVLAVLMILPSSAPGSTCILPE